MKLRGEWSAPFRRRRDHLLYHLRFLPGGPANLRPMPMLHILTTITVWRNLLLLTAFTTFVSFGLLSFFQPRIDPTRAALVYLAEPIFATLYAAIAASHRPGLMTLAGAGLILVANVFVEVVRSSGKTGEKVVLID